MKIIEILDDIGHRVKLGQIPDEDVEFASGVIDSLAITGEDVEFASGVIDSLAITGEAVTPLLAAQLRAFLAQSGIRLKDE
jgi:hypothetical protein